MSDLTEFLLARFEEDRGYAQYLINTGVQGPQYGTINEALGRVTERVLADCEAKRRIVSLHTPETHILWPEAEALDILVCPICWEYESVTPDDGEPCETLRALALPYADHPDFREEWKP